MKQDQFVTITGMSYYQGHNAINVGDVFCLVKEPGNSFDSDAIVVCSNLSCAKGSARKLKKSTLGYIAQSTHTIIEGTLSATEVYNSFYKCGKVQIMFKNGPTIIGKIVPYF